MVDLIPPGQSAQPPQQQPVPPPQSDPNNPANTAPADPAAQAVNGADQGGPRAVGTQQDAQDAKQQQDPTQELAVTPTEQAEMNQFISRFTMVISDTSKGKQAGQGPSLHDTILQDLNNPKLPLDQAIGSTTANVAFIIVQQAQHQKIQYSPDVLFHACFECVCLIYLMGNAAGIFKGVPPFTGLGDEGQYHFNDFELKLLTSAQMQAVRFFGTKELSAGMISNETRQANMAFWQTQVRREMATGQVNEDVLQRLHNSGLFNKQGSADPADQGPQPATPSQPQAPAPAASAAPPLMPPGASPTGGQ